MLRRVVPLIVFTAACVDSPSTGAQRVDVKVCAPGAVVEGMDVSSYQGTIDWAAVKAGGIQFAIIRTSDGLSFPDSKFAQYWPAARAAGVIRGVYQYFEPAQDPIAQADMMLTAMGPLSPGDLPPTIDVETTGGRTPTELAAEVKAWVDHVAAATGKTPIIYVGKYFWQDQVGGVDPGAASLWEAQWGVTCPDTPSPWTDWKLWQYSATGTVAGISGQVDLDRFNGDLAALGAFGGETAVCGDGHCDAGEDSDTCAADCPPCGVIELDGTIDDGDACFVGGGDPMYLRAVDGSGWNNDLIWTHATSNPAEASSATWELHLAHAGRYRVEVYTAAAYAQSKQAHYAINHGGVTNVVTIDQTAVDGWQTLGSFVFATGGKQSIHLGDNTGEPLAGNVQLVFDAVRLSVDPGDGVPPDSDGGGDMHGGCAAGGGGVGGGAGAILIVLSVAIRCRRRRAARG